MKKFLLKVTLFFVLVAVLDVMFGWGFDILRSKARGGQTRKNAYIANECMDDILILGSSKASHHYVPSVFEDSLGLTCYNAGEMGCGIIPAYIRYKMVTERRRPKLVIYEVTPQYDYLEGSGYSTYLGVIRQYTHNKMVRDVYSDFSDEFEGLRLLSNMYKNNSKLIINVKDCLEEPDGLKGYEPLYGKINNNKKKKLKGGLKKDKDGRQVDSLKYAYYEKLIEDVKEAEIPLLFIISPTFDGSLRNNDYQPAFELCQKYDIPVIDYRQCEAFVGNCELFQDAIHLNNQGAFAFSKSLAPQIGKYLNNN